MGGYGAGGGGCRGVMGGYGATGCYRAMGRAIGLRGGAMGHPNPPCPIDCSPTDEAVPPEEKGGKRGGKGGWGGPRAPPRGPMALPRAL